MAHWSEQVEDDLQELKDVVRKDERIEKILEDSENKVKAAVSTFNDGKENSFGSNHRNKMSGDLEKAKEELVKVHEVIEGIVEEIQDVQNDIPEPGRR